MGEYDFSVTYPDSLGHLDRKVQNAVSHWKYNPRSYEYDVALLRFDEPVKFKPNVIPICLSDDNEDLAGQTGWITGWGTLYEGKEFTHCKLGHCNENRYSLCPHSHEKPALITGKTYFHYREPVFITGCLGFLSSPSACRKSGASKNRDYSSLACI